MLLLLFVSLFVNILLQFLSILATEMSQAILNEKYEELLKLKDSRNLEVYFAVGALAIKSPKYSKHT